MQIDHTNDVQWTVHPKGVSPLKRWVDATRLRRVRFLRLKPGRAVLQGDTLSVQVSGLKSHIEPFVFTIFGSLLAWYAWHDGGREERFNAAAMIAGMVTLWVGFLIRGLRRGFANKFIIVDRDSGTLSLPWWSQTFPLGRVTGFQLLHARPTPGSPGTIRGLELHVLVHRNDLPMRYFIGLEPDADSVRSLLDFTGLPLDEYDPGEGDAKKREATKWRNRRHVGQRRGQ